MQNEPNQHPGGKPPFMKPCKEISYEDLGNGIYVFTAPPIGNHQYLIVGTEKALLIDTGFSIESLKEKIEEITMLPLILVNTHGHPDHCGGMLMGYSQQLTVGDHTESSMLLYNPEYLS
jgi:glyoxylase-like metal-dependent hydrolase (beta-lactamase superfamily II)